MKFIISAAFVMMIWCVSSKGYQIIGKCAVHNRFDHGYSRTTISKQVRGMFSGIVEVLKLALDDISKSTLASSKRRSLRHQIFTKFRKWVLSKSSK